MDGVGGSVDGWTREAGWVVVAAATVSVRAGWAGLAGLAGIELGELTTECRAGVYGLGLGRTLSTLEPVLAGVWLAGWLGVWLAGKLAWLAL